MTASRYDWQVVSLTITTSVAMSYFQALGLQDELRVARNNLARATRDLDGLVDQQRMGLVPLLAVVQQQVVVDGLAAALPPLAQQLAATKDALAILVGKLPEALELPAGSLLDLSLPAVSPGLPSELLLRRPDVQQAEAQLISANANITVARAQFFPSFGLNADGGVSSLLLASGAMPALGVYSFSASRGAWRGVINCLRRGAVAHSQDVAAKSAMIASKLRFAHLEGSRGPHRRGPMSGQMTHRS